MKYIWLNAPVVFGDRLDIPLMHIPKMPNLHSINRIASQLNLKI